MTPTAKEAATELKREIYQRSRVYPRWVADGRLEQREADTRNARMAKGLEIVEAAAAQEKAEGDLFGDAATPNDVTDALLELAECRDALRELVATKDMREREGDTPEYQARRMRAWERARRVLAQA